MELNTLEVGHIDWANARAYKTFRKVTVLGAGTMGAQIAAHLANAGLQVRLLDIAPEEGSKNAIVEKLFKKATKLKPAPLFTPDVAKRVQLGNFDENFDWVADASWVIEAVVERMDIKRQVMARIAETVSDKTIVSTNTSGLPIHLIAEGLPLSFRKRFLGTHFFNPPRYLRLLEIIPTPDTDPEIIARIAHFGRVHLGKGIVVAKDTPNFIGNRIGIYGMMHAIRSFTEGGYSIEEVDTLTGPLTGRPRSGTFRTADVVGLDTMLHVATNLYDAIPEDESREIFVPPALLKSLVENGALGSKTKAGFYKKVGRDILSIDPASGEYTPAAEMDLGDLKAIKKAGALPARLQALYAYTGRAGAFFRASTHDMLGYSARRIPEIADDPSDIDKAMQWGFGWELGPFGIWDAIGFKQVLDDMRAAGQVLPAWVDKMEADGATGFYKDAGSEPQVYLPGKSGYSAAQQPADERGLTLIKTNKQAVLWQNEEAALLDMGDGVALYEFRSKANSLGSKVMQGFLDVIEKAENDPNIRGIVVANEGKNFSVGANLGEMAAAAQEGKFHLIDETIANFQKAVQRIRYAQVPVVVAPHQRVLGGGCEVCMASYQPVAAAETYMGLVELGVGLIPAGTGTTFLAVLASQRAAAGFPNQVLDHLQVYFQQVAMATVSASGLMAKEMGYLSPRATVVMNDARRFPVAKDAVYALSESGYLPPPVNTNVHVLGKPGKAALEVAVRQYENGGFISEYDRFLAVQLAHVMTGGDLSGPQEVHEDYLVELEARSIPASLW